jgi:hypothetical protein
LLQTHPAIKTILAIPVIKAFSWSPRKSPWISIAGAQIMEMVPSTRLFTQFSFLATQR